MRRSLVLMILIVIFVSAQVGAMSSEPEEIEYSTVKHARIENVEVIEEFEIPQFGGLTRKILIYLPPDYQQSEKSYPVLYMHDGQNVFDEKTSFAGEWKVDETINRLVEEDKTQGAIVVAIYNSDKRACEYSPWKDNGNGAGIALGDKYVDFIVKTLKPYIDNHYRTLAGRENTGIAGSSYGGLISLYAALKYQDVFSKAGVFSPVFTLGKSKIYDYVKKQGKKDEMRIYMDLGEKEWEGSWWNKEFIKQGKRMDNLLKEVGFSKEEYLFVVDKDGYHNETSWSKRFPKAFLWLYE